MQYEYPSYKVDSKNGGSELAGETAASLVCYLFHK